MDDIVEVVARTCRVTATDIPISRGFFGLFPGEILSGPEKGRFFVLNY